MLLFLHSQNFILEREELRFFGTTVGLIGLEHIAMPVQPGKEWIKGGTCVWVF